MFIVQLTKLRPFCFSIFLFRFLTQPCFRGKYSGVGNDLISSGIGWK